MARTTGDTMAEGLQKSVSQLSTLLTLPDADMDFLNGIINEIASYLREGASSAQGLNMPPGPGAMGPASATPTPAMMGGMGMGMPPGGGMGIQPPNMDELNRTLGSQVQTG